MTEAERTPPSRPRGAPSDTAVDDYLKTIYAHTEWQPAPITPSGLAAKLGLAPSSVTEMVTKLVEQGLAERRPYGPVRLTDAGTRRALQVIRRHRLVETWLVEQMGYDWADVHDEAEVLEHVISDRLLDAVDARLGRPAVDPHGDAIPSAAGEVSVRPFLLLADAPAGSAGRVLRIDDHEPAALDWAREAGIRIGDAVEVTASGVRVGERDTHAVPAAAAAAVWLSAPAS
jgi:DtxR family transcriptional regulator, Mn-dependent transcriptional regulator